MKLMHLLAGKDGTRIKNSADQSPPPTVQTDTPWLVVPLRCKWLLRHLCLPHVAEIQGSH